MIIIGITGSIGMGKTTVSKMLRILKIPVFDSDRAVKEILEILLKKVFPLRPKRMTCRYGEPLMLNQILILLRVK